LCGDIILRLKSKPERKQFPQDDQSRTEIIRSSSSTEGIGHT
jgi:hypothetical protein